MFEVGRFFFRIVFISGSCDYLLYFCFGLTIIMEADYLEIFIFGSVSHRTRYVFRRDAGVLRCYRKLLFVGGMLGKDLLYVLAYCGVTKCYAIDSGGVYGKANHSIIQDGGYRVTLRVIEDYDRVHLYLILHFI